MRRRVERISSINSSRLWEVGPEAVTDLWPELEQYPMFAARGRGDRARVVAHDRRAVLVIPWRDENLLAVFAHELGHLAHCHIMPVESQRVSTLACEIVANFAVASLLRSWRPGHKLAAAVFLDRAAHAGGLAAVAADAARLWEIEAARRGATLRHLIPEIFKVHG